MFNGSKLSAAAMRPPRPPHLATPSALPNLEVVNDQRVYVCKRDARVYFDQLALPEALQPYFGRPPVRVRDLIATGVFTWAELHTILVESIGDDALVYPICRTWPVGFAWSSYIAQSVLLARCLESGVENHSNDVGRQSVPHRHVPDFRSCNG